MGIDKVFELNNFSKYNQEELYDISLHQLTYIRNKRGWGVSKLLTFADQCNGGGMDCNPHILADVILEHPPRY